MPNTFITLIEIFVVVYTLYIVQRFVMNAQTMIRQSKAKKIFDKCSGLLLESTLKGLTAALGDITKKEKTTSEKDENLNGSDDPDVNDFLD